MNVLLVIILIFRKSKFKSDLIPPMTQFGSLCFPAKFSLIDADKSYLNIVKIGNESWFFAISNFIHTQFRLEKSSRVINLVLFHVQYELWLIPGWESLKERKHFFKGNKKRTRFILLMYPADWFTCIACKHKFHVNIYPSIHVLKEWMLFHGEQMLASV